MSKTKVQMKSEDSQYKEWEKGEVGYIDGYVRGANDIPFAVVVIDHRIILAPTNQLTVIKQAT